MKCASLLALLLALSACNRPKFTTKEPALAPAPLVEALPEPIRGKDYQLVFEETFDGPAGSPAASERWSDWDLGRRKDAFNVPGNCLLDGNGNLAITVRRNNDRIETGGIHTLKKFLATHGYFECRAKPANVSGAWSAFWIHSPTIGKPIGNPAIAGIEIDVLECFPGHWKMKGQARNCLHWDGYGKDHKVSGGGRDVPDITENFHTYAVKWDEEGYVFYIDGVENNRMTDVPVSNRPEYLILSCEAQKWSGKIEEAKLPDAFVIDHVRVWQTPAQIGADAKRPDAVRPAVKDL